MYKTHESSEEADVTSGVPQGTVLGPILFLIHINDLPKAVSSSVRLFADDCLLYRRIRTRDDHTRLQKDLVSLEKWAKENGMSFNAKKCYILSIRNKSSHFYQLNNTILVLYSEPISWGVVLVFLLKFERRKYFII